MGGSVNGLEVRLVGTKVKTLLKVSGWAVDGSVGRWVGQSLGWSVGRPAGCLVSGSVSGTVGGWVVQSLGGSVDWSVGQSVCQSISGSVDG